MSDDKIYCPECLYNSDGGCILMGISIEKLVSICPKYDFDLRDEEES